MNINYSKQSRLDKWQKTIEIVLFIDALKMWYNLIWSVLFVILVTLLTIDILFLTLGTETKLAFMTSFFITGIFSELDKIDYFVSNLTLFNLIRPKMKSIENQRQTLVKSWIISHTQLILLKLSILSEFTGRLTCLPIKSVIILYKEMFSLMILTHKSYTKKTARY